MREPGDKNANVTVYEEEWKHWVGGRGGCKGEYLTEHTPQDVPSNATFRHRLTVYAYQRVMRPCTAKTKGLWLFAVILPGAALDLCSR